MGLDNIPVPKPCEYRGYAVYKIINNERRIDCEKTNCPYKTLPHTIGIFGTYCWLRGGVYNDIVTAATKYKYSLYNELRLDELKEIYDMLRQYTPTEVDSGYYEELLVYLETLIADMDGCKDFKLIAWY